MSSVGCPSVSVRPLYTYAFII
uniref:Uncharacterized protein n=1 Tax=Rhizophora mucronata TaxID=61149 RepID=A0A2P2P502_RHIMU